jgi:putative ABC transport system ATP-binding protein
MGFVFQNFQLIPNLSAIENVMLPLELGGTPARTARTQAASSLDQVGLQERLDYYPAQLSGGEQQRVAIARALVHTPSVLFADEPTGNLDLENASKIIDLLFSLNSAAGVALVLVTHNPDIAARCSRQIALRGGKIAHG